MIRSESIFVKQINVVCPVEAENFCRTESYSDIRCLTAHILQIVRFFAVWSDCI